MDCTLGVLQLSEWQRFLNRLLSRNHLLYAIDQEDRNGDDLNRLPIVLAALFQLGAASDQLQRIASRMESGLQPWRLSEHRLLDRERCDYFGNRQYQRGYMDYFSADHTNKGGGATAAWAVEHLLRSDATCETALVFGLFGRLGRSLLFLGEGLGLPNALLVVQGLTLAAVDWSAPMQQIVTGCASAPRSLQEHWDSPLMPCYPLESMDTTWFLDRIRTDGRFSGLKLTGTPNEQVVLGQPNMRNAITMYTRQLDLSDMDSALNYLSRLSVLMACASHKPDSPAAFDVHFARLPSLVFSLRMLLQACDQYPGAGLEQRSMLVRGVWMLILVTFVLRGRPVITEALVAGQSMLAWDQILADCRRDLDRPQSKYEDPTFPTLILSIVRLAGFDYCRDDFYRTAASYLLCKWKGWGAEESSSWGAHLNITTL